MKKQLLIYTLGFLTPIFIGAGIASGTDILTVKPATPKSTVIIDCSWGELSSDKREILEYYKKGYVVSKTVSVDSRALVVMEKY